MCITPLVFCNHAWKRKCKCRSLLLLQLYNKQTVLLTISQPNEDILQQMYKANYLAKSRQFVQLQSHVSVAYAIAKSRQFMQLQSHVSVAYAIAKSRQFMQAHNIQLFVFYM